MKNSLWIRFAAVYFLLTAFVAGAGDWPQWRGPNRDGLSKETGLLKEWPKDGPRLIWQNKAVGVGYSTPSIAAGRVFVMGSEGMDKEYVLALSTSDGKQAWSTIVGKVGPNDERMNYPGSRATPTVDGNSLFALGSDGDLAALDTATGKVLWSKSFRSEFGGQPGRWAYSESPLVDGDLLIAVPGGSNATVVALNKKSGQLVWKHASAGADQAAYASPIVTEIGGTKQFVIFLEKGLVGLDAKSGRQLWRYEGTAKGSPANIPTPVADNGLVFSGAGRTGGGLIRVSKGGDTFSVEQVAFTPKLPTAIGGAVKVGNHLYGSTSKALVCAEFATGSLKWEETAIGAASLIHADGRFYLHGESGEVALVEATPQGYSEKGRFKPADAPDRGKSKAWAYPALSDGRLYIRDMTSLWCYDVKASQ